MDVTDLAELLRDGENSTVEFERDGVHPERIAASIAGLLNHGGGYVLLGVEDDGSVTGLALEPREAAEWAMLAARDHLRPAYAPGWEAVEWDRGKFVGVIALRGDAPDTPYKAKRGSAWVARVRAGATTREATREEEERLYRRWGSVAYGLKPVLRAGVGDLDMRRLRDYFARVRGGGAPSADDAERWETLLRNMNYATEAAGRVTPTVDGMLLFGADPGRFVPQSGVRALCCPGTGPGRGTGADEVLKGPLVPLVAEDGSIAEPGLADRALDFVRRNTAPPARLEGARRLDGREYPEEAVREAIVNALVHRDYGIEGTDVTLTLFSDRMEIASPGRLPNTVTVGGMKSGARYARNQALANVMRDYGYVDARGMGVRNKVIPAMRDHNGTEPDLIAEEHRFTVRLRKAP